MLLPSRTITFEAALRDLGSRDPRVRAAAADALGDAAEGDEQARAVAGLLGAIADERFEVRCAAVLSLGDLGAAAAVDGLVARLDDDHSQVRQAAAIALGRIGDSRAFAALARALDEGAPDVRFQAAASLVEIDPARAYDPLVAAVRDGDPEVRGNVAAALGAVGDTRATGWLAELLDDASPATRFEAARALAHFRDPRAVEPLISFLADRDRAFATVEALEAAGDRGAAPHLAALMGRLLVGRALRVRAAAALLALDPAHPEAQRARQLLAKSARARREDVRGLAEEALARLGSG